MAAFDLGGMGILKLIYADPRPYMVDNSIRAYKCVKEYGNPSGHSSGASALVITLFLDTFHGKTMIVKNTTFYSNFTYYAILVIFTIYGIAMPYTRFLMGIHSLDQVIFGFCIGIFYAYMLHFIIRDPLYKHMASIPRWSNDKDKMKKKFSKYFPQNPAVMITGIFIVFNLLTIAIFLYLSYTLDEKSPKY